MPVTKILFSLLRHEIISCEPPKEVVDGITDEMLIKLYTTSKKYDIASIIASSLSKLGKLGLSDDASKAFRKELALSVMRYETMNYDYERICKTFEDEKIQYIPLKGSVIRKFYPEPFMRTSCDIDILVKENDLDRAVNTLVEKLSFTTKGNRDFHDVSVFSESETHLELHFNIMENMENVDELLGKVWEYAVPSEDGSCRYEMTNEYLIFHNISHMSYHFVNGGCGIRPFVDLYLLEKNLDYDKAKLSELCEGCSLEKFRIAVENTAKVWLENQPQNELSERIEKHIFSGGLYGNLETGSAVMQAQQGGHFKYVMSRVFQPYNVIKEKYPVLKKHKWLMPVCQVRRWFFVLSNKRDGIAKHLKAGKNVSKNVIDEKIKLLKDVGLN